MGQWFEEEDFWKKTETSMFDAERFESARVDLPKILELVGAEPRRVLDLCCGPGRFAVPFAERGFTVTGVDRTRLLLDRAEAHAREHGVTIELVEQDMRDFVRPESFEVALNLFTSFGYFDNPNDNQRVLENLFRSLVSGGKLVMDLLGKEILARIFQPTSATDLPDGKVWIQRRRILPGFERIEVQWLLLDDGRYESLEFTHFLYSAAELRTMLQAAGFSD